MAWESADPLVRYRTFEEIETDLPHPMSDHVPMHMFACECDCDGVKVRLVLPESEDLVVDVYSALGKPNDDPHWADLWHGSVALAAATTTTDDGAPGHRRAPSAPSIPTSYDFMDDSERAPPNPGPGAYSLAGDMNHRVGTGSIGVKGYGPLVSGAARLQAADARGGESCHCR